MPQHFNERWFRISSVTPGVAFIVVGRDSLGWKMDVHGDEHRDWPDGDTYQDTLDELFPFLAKYADASSIWTGFDTGVQLSMWDAIVSVTGVLDAQ